MASSRRTYDTDSITLRTVFAKNPGNSNVPALRVLTADGAGGTYWAIPSSLGLNPSFNEIITSAATYTADLSYNKFRLLAGEGIGMVNGPSGSNATTLFAKAFSQFDVSGENSLSAFTNNQLDASVTLAAEGGLSLRADPATNTLFFVGPSATATVSTGIYGFSQLKVTPASSTITSSVQNFGGSYLTATSPSTLLRFLGYNDIQLSTNTTTNSVYFTISTFTSQGYLAISNAAFSAYPSSLSTVSSLYTQNSVFASTITSLSSVTGLQFSSVLSSINALAMSTGDNFYLLTGLINARATIAQLNDEIAGVNSNMISTVGGLGSAGYISTAGGGSGDVTSGNLLSTVRGLGTSGYVSTSGLVSTTLGLQTSGFLSTSALVSTTYGLQTSGFLSSATLVSTVTGLGSVGYVSTLSSLTISTLFNTGAISTYSLEVYGSNTLTNSGSTILRGGIYLQGPTYFAGSVSGAPNTIVNASDLVSTVDGLGSAEYISTASLMSSIYGSISTFSTSLGAVGSGNLTQANLTSTVVGLGTIGYVSSVSGFFQLSTGFLTTSSITMFDTETNALNFMTVSGATLLLNGNFVAGGGGGGGGGGGVSQLIAGTGIALSPVNGLGNVTITNTGPTAANIASTVTGLATLGYLSTTGLTSTVTGLGAAGYISTSALASTVGGLGQNYVSTLSLRSTVGGLGNAGYISTSALTSTTYGLQTSGFLSTSALTSTTYGLQTSGFLSTSALTSTTFGLQTAGFVSAPNLLTLVSTSFLNTSLVSTTYGLQTSGFLSTSALTSTTFGLQTAGFVSAPNLLTLVSTPFLNTSLVSTTYGLQTSGFLSTSALVSTTYGLQTSGFISSANLTSSMQGLSNVALIGLVQGTNITITPVSPGILQIAAAGGGGGGITSGQLVSTTYGLQTSGFLSTTALVSTTYGLQTSGFLSTSALVSTTYGLQTSGFISSPNLTSSMQGLSNIVVTRLIAGTNITLTPSGGKGDVTIDAAGGGGGGITTANLTSTVTGLGSATYVSTASLFSSFANISTNSIVLSTSDYSYALTASTNMLTAQPNLWMNQRIYGSYNPVKVIVSSLTTSANPQLFEYDIGKYFLLENTCNVTINLPTPDPSLDGWNVVLKNMPTSPASFIVNTTATAVIAPGVATTIICDGTSFYSI